jgi:hypothetical protein
VRRCAVLFIAFFVYLVCFESSINASLPPIAPPDEHESYYYSNGDVDSDSYDAEKDMGSWFVRYNKKIFQHNQIIQKQKKMPKKHQNNFKQRKYKKRNTKKRKTKGDDQ